MRFSPPELSGLNYQKFQDYEKFKTVFPVFLIYPYSCFFITGEKLKFKSIEEEEGGNYFGLTKLKSRTSKELQKMGLIGRETGKLYSFDLETLSIQKIQEKNKTVSTIGTIALVVVGLLVVIFTVAAISFSNDGFAIW